MGETKHKIAIISYSLGGGGAERFAGSLSFILQDLGHEIHHVIMTGDVVYPYAGRMFNLDEAVGAPTSFRKFHKALAMQRYLRRHDINVVIDNRTRNQWLRDWVNKSIFGSRKRIYVVHSSNLSNYLPQSVFLARWLYADAEKLVCVSRAIAAKVLLLYGLRNTKTIFNPVNLSHLKIELPVDAPEKYVLFFGRLDEKVKNFTLMLDAFSASGIVDDGYKLLIIGDGPSRDAIVELLKKRSLQPHVLMIPFLENPFGYVALARFTILTSRFEGFPMALIESLALGTPVVSVDCDSGPAEIIENESNGLLVPNHDAPALAQAMQRLAQDRNLYDICKKNAARSVAHLSVENTSNQWQQIL